MRPVSVAAAVVAALVLAAVALAAGLALGRSGGDESTGTGSSTIAVSGTGTVEAALDVAEFGFGVSTKAKTARAALAANAKAMQRVVRVVKAKGVDSADIQTAQVSVSPDFSRSGNRVVGYTAANAVTVRIRRLPRAGETVDAVVAAGANEVSGPTFTSADDRLVYRKALRLAMADARSKAEAIAAAEGVELGDLRSADEGENRSPIPLEAKASAQASSTPVEPGTATVEAAVDVAYDVD
jgi:hypothetical protein